MVDIFDITNKVVVFTGSTGHLGRPAADHLESAGATVVRVSRNGADGKNSYKLDIVNDVARKRFVAFIRKRFGKIDGLVNNAYSGTTGKIEHTTRSEFENSVNMTLSSPFFLIQELVPYFRSGASIVNIASMYGVVSPDPRIYGDSGQDNPVYYGAGKAGLIQMSKYLGCHLADKNIRTNSISPGAFPNLSKAGSGGRFQKQLITKIPVGRIGVPSDLIGVIHFLLSDSSTYINGANIPVDGGWTAW